LGLPAARRLEGWRIRRRELHAARSQINPLHHDAERVAETQLQARTRVDEGEAVVGEAESSRQFLARYEAFDRKRIKFDVEAER
jgi:hypothetical protein